MFTTMLLYIHVLDGSVSVALRPFIAPCIKKPEKRLHSVETSLSKHLRKKMVIVKAQAAFFFQCFPT